ncbi:hypothetical protein HDZ31DRAFT_38080 [Schizophyllum fasciatum]
MGRARQKKDPTKFVIGRTTRKYRAKAIWREEQEERIQAAIRRYKDGAYRSLREAARDNGIRHPSTLTRRFGGHTQSRDIAHARQQLLRRSVEDVLVEWSEFVGKTGKPLCKRTLAPLVERLCGRKPSRTWIYRFLGRHPRLLQNRGQELDPQRAQAFNKPAVVDTCKKLDDFFLARRVSARNTANIDELGFQLCGNSSGSSTLYLFSASDTNRYLLKGTDLQMVTVLECIFLDGTIKVRPCFVFEGIKFHESWGIGVEGNPLCVTKGLILLLGLTR